MLTSASSPSLLLGGGSRRGNSSSGQLPSLLFNIFFFFLLLTACILAPSTVNAKISCTESFDCERTLGRKGSDCVDGYCTNPFRKGGCLSRTKKGWTKLRTCNSEDPPDFLSKGYCQLQDEGIFDYGEIRIHPQNWMSVTVETWILQILLSEVLDVPVTVETSFRDLNSNFYDTQTRMDFGSINNDYNATETAKLLDGDCTQANLDPIQPYQPCCHFIPENWLGLSPESGLTDLFGYDPSTKALEPPIQLGSISQEGWYVPKFTADKDGSLLSFFGLQGEDNRRKLAETFKRPIRWGDYCEIVTPDNCTSDHFNESRAAFGPPPTIEKANSFFVEGSYEGYFMATEANDCDKWPNNCTGHIADFPCGWSSNLRTNTFWNNIALESNGNEDSGGYTYGELVQIMMAANATKSDLMILWWYPDLDFQRYLGTDSELIKVILPTVTQECLDNLVSAEDRCSLNETLRNGDKRGACDDAPLPLQKVMASVTQDYAKNPDVPVELQSPAYDVLREFQLTSYQIGEVFDRFFDLNIDPDNYDLRQATCDWFVDNFDSMTKFVPEGFPRTIQSANEQMTDPITYAAIAFGAISVVAVLFAVAGTFFQRNLRSVKLAPIEFLLALLLGLSMVSGGSILLAIPNPNNAICIASIWMVNVGYTLEVAPIIVKMTAIFQVIRAAERMQHLEFSKKTLFTSLLAFNLVIVVFLIVWSVMDPPQRDYEYDLIDNTNSNTGGYEIAATPYCSSEFESWYWVAVAWHFFLLVIATAQAFQARAIIRKLEDENQTLAFMIYSHFIFACLRVATYWFEDSESGFSYSDLAMARSLVYSIDTLFTIGIYFVPKLFNCFQNNPAATSNSKAKSQGSINSQGRVGESNKAGVPQTKSEREYDYLARMTHVDEEIDGDENEGGELEGFDVPSNEEIEEDVTANNSSDEMGGGSNRIQHYYEDSNANQHRPAAAYAAAPSSDLKRRPSGGDDQPPGAHHRHGSDRSAARRGSGGLNHPLARQSNEFSNAPAPLRAYGSSEDDFKHPGYGNDDFDRPGFGNDDDFDHPGYVDDDDHPGYVVPDDDDFEHPGYE